ncbi:MAG: Usg family protein [Alphaproteobacteria bacterium]|nr:Usg family protein [Alphaproteobacteria bacterium]
MGNEDLRLRLLGFRPVTAEIVYRLPDYPDLLQTFVWQQLDRVPEYPRLKDFLTFWRRNIEGRLFSVRVAPASAPLAGRLRHAGQEFRLH